MAKLSSADLLDAFKEMTLLELSDFVKQFEETFDVTAAAPVAVAAAPAAGGGGGDVEGLLERLHELAELDEGELLERVEQLLGAELCHDDSPYSGLCYAGT